MSVKCEFCGNELPGQVKFCPKCGGSVSQAKSYDTNVSATEPLLSDTFQRKTEAFIPDTEEFAPVPTSTNKISQPATDTLKQQTVAAVLPTAPMTSKSPMKIVAVVALVLIVAMAALSMYFAAQKSSETAADAAATPSPIVQPSPVEALQPVNSATPDAQASPPEVTAEKASESAADVAGGKSKSSAGGTSATASGKSEAPPGLTASDHIKQGVNAGNPSAALAEYQQALKLDPANMDVHYLMGLAYQQLGQLDKALAAYSKCTSGQYASVAAQHVKRLEKDLKKTKY